jgi:hypothetical protein
MGNDPNLTTHRDTDVELSDTARIDRRKTILAQIEAALLANKLSLEQMAQEASGTDPYNSGVYKSLGDTGVWKDKRPR